jgi:FkbH-like protein
MVRGSIMRNDINESFPKQLHLWLRGDILKYRVEEKTLDQNKEDFLKSNREFFREILKNTKSKGIKIIPLAQNQKALWFLYLVNTEAVPYNISLAIEIFNEIKLDAIKCSFTYLTKRHKQLRTIFANLPGTGNIPCQIVLDEVEVEIEKIDGNNLSTEEIRGLLNSKNRIPFNLKKGPLFRIIAVTTDNSTILCFNFHHIICDALSLKVLVNEFTEFYDSILRNEEIEPDTPVIDYSHYVYNQLELLDSAEGEKQIEYWLKHLEGRSFTLDLPAKSKRPSVHRFNGSTFLFRIDGDRYKGLKSIATNTNSTFNVMLLSVFEFFISRISGKSDFCVGLPTAARVYKDYEDLFGYLINLLPVGCLLNDNITFKDFLDENKASFYSCLENQEIPFPTIVERLSPKRDLSRTPVFQVIFNYLNKKSLGPLLHFLGDSDSLEKSSWGSFSVKPFKIFDQEGQVDITLEIIDDDEKLLCALKYNSDLFDEDIIRGFSKEFLKTTDLIIEDYNLKPSWLSDVSETEDENPPFNINITGTFTVEPVEPYLKSWLDEFNTSGIISFTGYNQVFTQLLNPGSEFNQSHDGYNILMVRLEDWMADRRSPKPDPEFLAKIDDFEQALASSLETNLSGMYIVAFCPPSPLISGNPILSEMIEESERRLCDYLDNRSNTMVLNSTELLHTYEIREYYEEMGEETGHIPYTEEFFACLATLIARKINLHRRTPFKAIAVDCDNTLWRGIVGEEGPLGVTIGHSEKELQEFLIEQSESGILVCLCSKNNEEDVFEVFEKNDQMILKREHIAFYKINWDPKSNNLLQLADDINIGPDSIVYIDDNPAECAEVRNNATDILTIQLSEGGVSRKQLYNSWIFDKLRVTDEDRKRPDMYKEESRRSKFRATAESFYEFIQGLNLKIDIKPFQDNDIPRVSQLTYRTNQFNFTTLRKSEGEIGKIASDRNYDTFQVSLSDRFGEYGITGVIIVDKTKGYYVETFLLSCRVLGKGVEHSIIAHLGEQARLNNSEFLTIPFRKTEKNVPARDFLMSNFGKYATIDSDYFVINIPSEQAAEFKFDPGNMLQEVEIRAEEKTTAVTSNLKYRERNNFYLKIFEKLTSIEGILREYHNEYIIRSQDTFAKKEGSLKTVTNVMTVWKELLRRSDFSKKDNFFDIGGHSILIPQMVIKLFKEYKIKIDIVDVFQYPTVNKLTNFIDGNNDEESKVKGDEGTKMGISANRGIAVVGMACRYPGARNLDEFWKNLVEGKETIKHFTDEELEKNERNYSNLKENPNYVKARGILDDIDKFDAAFFDMTSREAALMDPQHRVWLECTWDALENAGCDPSGFLGAIGVFAGGYVNTYLLNNILRDPDRLENYIRMRTSESLQILTANDTAHLPTKTAYKFNLKGPAINVQTACSTSLVAICQACDSLNKHESDVCIAGGVFIMVPQESGYLYEEGAIISPDGSCRPFDDDARGTVFSNGAGVVVLKRLEDAIRDRDNIYAIVEGWAMNNDGSNKISYTAPSVDGQADVIMKAQSSAGISPEQISYIETHGTATHLGDPIEIAALDKAFSRATDLKQYCGVGSVKSNIGHTDAAAGVASFIKTSLAAYRRLIPPSINFSKPNKLIKFEDTPFYVQKKLRKWDEEKPMIMGVSSFGVGGTNAHVILREPIVINEPEAKGSEWPAILYLSAKSENSLERRKHDLVNYIKANPYLNIKDIAYTLGTGRSKMTYRSYIVVSEKYDNIEAENFIDGGKTYGITKTAFLFPGQGAQYIDMGKDLYYNNQLFHEILDECFYVYESETGNDLKKIIYESPDNKHARLNLSSTQFTQPALFIIEYALARVLDQMNIRPEYMIGHSIGEYTAACIAGVFDLHTALKIVIKRGELMQNIPTGEMMAVFTNIEKLKRLDNKYFEIAADNSSSSCSISFKSENKNKVKKILRDKGINFLELNTSHAFHSEAFESILSEFAGYVNQLRLAPPEIPFISCLTGKYITDEDAVSGDYWAKQLRYTVQFREGISTIAGNEDVIFLEVGPETHLSSIVKLIDSVIKKDSIISTLGKPDGVNEFEKVLGALGKMFLLGKDIDLDIIYKEDRPRKVVLPLYPYERQRYWIDFFQPQDLSKQETSSETQGGLQENEAAGAGENEMITEGQDVASLSSVSQGYNSTEQIILGIWSDAFMNKAISLQDDFFDLGGDSLLAITVTSKMKAAFSLELRLNVLFEKPRIKDLAIFVDELKKSADN